LLVPVSCFPNVAYSLFHFAFLPSLKFCVVTFSSVGYGDITPDTKSQKIWTCFFILVGVAVTANMVGVLTSVVHERRERKLAAAKTILHDPNAKVDQISFGEWIDVALAAMWEKLELIDSYVRVIFDKVTGYAEIQISLLERRLTGEIHMSEIMRESTGNNTSWWKKLLTPSIERPSDNGVYDHRVLNHSTQVAIHDLRRMKQQLHRDTQDMRYQSFHDFIWIWVMIMIGANSMQVIEDWKLNDAYYWSVVTITTVGYGDIVPTTRTGKVFTIFFILIGTGLMANTLGNLISVSFTN
jgi:hypothetical protein